VQQRIPENKTEIADSRAQILATIRNTRLSAKKAQAKV